MTIDLVAPPTPRWPGAAHATTFALGRDADGPAVQAALDEALGDEWDYHPLRHDEWLAYHRRRGREDEALWVIAREGEEIAGVAVCDWFYNGGGWIGGIGLRPAFRNRGLGRALLETAFARFWERGIRSVSLAVDADNPTAARRFYERVGMRAAWEAVVVERAL